MEHRSSAVPTAWTEDEPVLVAGSGCGASRSRVLVHNESNDLLSVETFDGRSLVEATVPPATTREYSGIQLLTLLLADEQRSFDVRPPVVHHVWLSEDGAVDVSPPISGVACGRCPATRWYTANGSTQDLQLRTWKDGSWSSVLVRPGQTATLDAEILEARTETGRRVYGRHGPSCEYRPGLFPRVPETEESLAFPMLRELACDRTARSLFVGTDGLLPGVECVHWESGACEEIWLWRQGRCERRDVCAMMARADPTFVAIVANPYGCALALEVRQEGSEAWTPWSVPAHSNVSVTGEEVRIATRGHEPRHWTLQSGERYVIDVEGDEWALWHVVEEE